MRSLRSRLVLAVVASWCVVVLNVPNGRSVVAAQQPTPVTVTRIYAGSDGQTHAEQVDVKLTLNPLFAREQSETVKVTSSYLVRFPPGFLQDWHPAAERRYVITLSGQGEIELGGGQKLRLEPGRILQAEDVTGKGHITRTIGKTDWIALFVQFDH
jgi:quercetin dioxygenase-like cupin family protein